MAGLILVTPPAAEPISLATAKLHLKVEHTADDDLITAWIVAARRWAETFTGRQFVTATWDWNLDCFPEPGCELEIPRAPLQSITSISYFDTNGDSQTWSSSLYDVDTASEPGRVAPDIDQDWPATSQKMNAATIRFVAGYGDADDVPETIKAAMQLYLGHWYEHREEVTSVETFKVPSAAEMLLYSERVWSLR